MTIQKQLQKLYPALKKHIEISISPTLSLSRSKRKKLKTLGTLVPVLSFNNFETENLEFDADSFLQKDSTCRALEQHALKLARLLALLRSEGVDVPAILLIICSPGGSVLDFSGAREALEHMNSVLKIHYPAAKFVALCDRVCASGGYLLASAADQIVVTDSTIIGSIGVVASYPEVYEGLEKIGVKFNVVTAGSRKRDINYFAENSEDAKKRFESTLNDTHRYFKKKVASRNLHPDAMDGRYVTAGNVNDEDTTRGLFDEVSFGVFDYIEHVRSNHPLLYIGTPSEKSKSFLVSILDLLFGKSEIETELAKEIRLTRKKVLSLGSVKFEFREPNLS